MIGKLVLATYFLCGAITYAYAGAMHLNLVWAPNTLIIQ